MLYSQWKTCWNSWSCLKNHYFEQLSKCFIYLVIFCIGNFVFVFMEMNMIILGFSSKFLPLLFSTQLKILCKWLSLTVVLELLVNKNLFKTDLFLELFLHHGILAKMTVYTDTWIQEGQHNYKTRWLSCERTV